MQQSEDEKSPAGSIEGVLSDYVATGPERPLPPHVADLAKNHILDTFAAMISGAKLPVGERAISYVDSLGGRPEATLIGSAQSTNAVNAALGNGMLAHADETDDSHPPSITHPGCAVVPAAFAMAERSGTDGTTFLRAVMVGYDVGTRIMLALGPDRIIASGRSTHAIGGIFGAAAAAGCASRLSRGEAASMLAYTVQQASGAGCWLRDPDHVEKAFDFGGMPARNGVTAATLAAAGLTGSRDPISATAGLFHAFGPPADPSQAVARLGEFFEITRTCIKKWSVGSPIQAALDAVELLQKDIARIEDVMEVIVELPTRGASVVDNRAMPAVCLQHLVALMLVDGGLTFATIHDEARMADPAVRSLRDRVTLRGSVELDKALPARQAIVSLRMRDGSARTHHAKAVRGTPANPVTRAEVSAKATDLMAPVIGKDRAGTLVETILALESVTDMRSLRSLLIPG